MALNSKMSSLHRCIRRFAPEIVFSGGWSARLSAILRAVSSRPGALFTPSRSGHRRWAPCLMRTCAEELPSFLRHKDGRFNRQPLLGSTAPPPAWPIGDLHANVIKSAPPPTRPKEKIIATAVIYGYRCPYLFTVGHCQAVGMMRRNDCETASQNRGEQVL